MYSFGSTHAHGTKHAYMGQGAQEESHGIRISEFPPLLLMSNNKFTIPEPVLSIASIRQVIHYPRVT